MGVFKFAYPIEMTKFSDGLTHRKANALDGAALRAQRILGHLESKNWVLKGEGKEKTDVITDIGPWFISVLGITRRVGADRCRRHFVG